MWGQGRKITREGKGGKEERGRGRGSEKRVNAVGDRGEWEQRRTEGRGSEKAAGAQLSGDTGKALNSVLSTAKKISK